MKAAVVRDFGRPPTYSEFPDPVSRPGETVISVAAAAVSHLVVSRVEGTHYSSGTSPPFVPGVDGVGRTADGKPVYFAFPTPPWGSMAERTTVSVDCITPLPDDLDVTAAAAAANAGMSCWIPLTLKARIAPGESVLVNGATGISGQMAVQVAKHLGASKVIATGRDDTKLRALLELGADIVVSLRQSPEELRERLRSIARECRVGVVLDYLWGSSAEAILAALGGPAAPRGPSRIRYVEVGSVAGPAVSLDGALLRSSGVEILGTGLGSSTYPEIVTGIGQFLRALPTARFRIATEVHPLSEVERAWARASGEARLVFTIP